jgi:hypothetical protein
MSRKLGLVVRSLPHSVALTLYSSHDLEDTPHRSPHYSLKAHLRSRQPFAKSKVGRRKQTSQPCRKQHEGDMDYSAYQIDVPVALDPTFDIDLDEIFNGENATPHQSFQQAELYPAFNQGGFASPNVLPGEGYQIFLPQDDLASYDLFQPGLQGNTFNQEDFHMTENLLQSQIDNTFRQDQTTSVSTLSQGLFYDNNGQQGFHGTGILQSAGNVYMPESLRSNQASNQVNFQSSVEQDDLTASLHNIEQPCVDPVGVANQSRDAEKSGRGYSHAEWEAKKDVLHRLWVEENRTMSLLIETMTEVHGFTAS